MVINMVGDLLILLSCWALGEQAAGRLRLRWKQLKQLKGWLSFFRGKLIFEGVTVEEALKESAEIAGAPFCIWLTGLSERLNMREGDSFMQIWESGIDTYGRQWGIGEIELNGMRRFGGQLGLMDREHQVRAIDLLERSIDEGIRNAEEEISVKEKLYRSLGILTGCMIIILIW